MEWKFDEYDKNYACLTSRNPDIRFVIRISERVAGMFVVELFYTPYQYREIKQCYSKEEAMSFVENLVRGIKTME